MSDYEIIGRVTIWLGAIALGIGFLLFVQYLAWWAFKEIIGWLRIGKALKLLIQHEKEQQP